MNDISLFRKPIKVWIEVSGSVVFCKFSISGKVISKMKCVLDKNGTLLIGDITPFKKKSHYCKGYGSIMMDKLLAYAYEKKIHTISGNLSSVDNDNKDRLHAFYIKNGFEVIQYDVPKDLYYGKVIKKL